jgi:hypothetical protein
MKTMMRCLVVVIFVGTTSIQSNAQWFQTNGPSGGGVYCFAVSTNGASGTNLYAGTGNGVFLSTNNGTSWSAVDLPPVYVPMLS